MQAPSSGRTPSRSGFRPRQSNYLRISPTTVLQMILYLEPAHVEWMNNSVLERMLLALRDRIPLKLAQEGAGKAKGREKTQVDVFRGTDYQMAFFFRRASDKHVVLLKHKHFYEPQRAESLAPGGSGGKKRARSVSVASARDPSEGFRPEDDTAPRRAPKRHASSQAPLFAAEAEADVEDQQDDVVIVKDEPVDDDEVGLPPPSVHGEDDYVRGEDLGEVKLEDDGFDGDVKPELKVTYQSYRIFGRTLVVIVEPYPPLDPKDLARPLSGISTEVRQLSASVAPDSYRRRSTAAALGSRSSLSVTPAPAPENRPGGGLFRREETEDALSARGSVTPSLAGDDNDNEEDDQMRALRATSTLLANEWPATDQGGGEELPSLDDIINRSRGKGNVDGAGLEVEGEQPDGSI
ncbi:hypothetical protein JCM10908_003962 [Rhodotorula pacifica]|uniref:uncharacterized protein n=1 Tax=Rhodotorula pacifica TaxID=1495444 RepID=UPI0031785ED5